MRHSQYQIWLLTISLAAATLGAIIYATGMGHIAVPGADILRVIAARITGNGALLAGIDPVIPFVVLEVRLPRILTSTLVGGGLAMSGVIYQGILLNPLADPYTLGVSSGAASAGCSERASAITASSVCSATDSPAGCSDRASATTAS